MARIRSIKPRFWTDEKVVELSPWARLFFIGLWNFADDYGRMEFSERRLKMEIFPGDSVEVGELRGELEEHGLILIYSIDGKEYLQVVNFDKHQKVDKRSSSKIPLPPVIPAESPRIPPLDQGRDQEREGKGKGEIQQLGASGLPILPSNIPYKEIVSLFNDHMGKLSTVRDLTLKRRQAIRSAWQASKVRQDLKFWKSYFEEAQDDPFLNGTGPYGKGHENWRPTFDYLLRNDVITKTYEKAMSRNDAA